MFPVFDSQKTDQGENLSQGDLNNEHVSSTMSENDKEQWLEGLGINHVWNDRKISRSKGDHSFYCRNPSGTCIQLATPDMWQTDWT